MSESLTIELGQASTAGLKPVNQDFIGAYIPKRHQLSTKGIAVALADGISTSNVSQIASETAVSSFINDYYSTSEAWSTKHSALSVLKALNHWLYAQTKSSSYRFDFNRGYVCTFSAAIFKSQTAHLFHSGDSRIYRLSGQGLEQLTQDHIKHSSNGSQYLSRALGLDQSLSLDYQSIALQTGDTFLLLTDGIFDFLSSSAIAEVLNDQDSTTQQQADNLIDLALRKGSDDNLSAQIVRITQLPPAELLELHETSVNLPPPPSLSVGDTLDGYEILRELYVGPRSHVFVAKRLENQELLVLKTPSGESRNDEQHLNTFLLEDWILRKVSSPHLIKPYNNEKTASYVYTATNFISGTTLAQWMRDNPKPSLNQCREILIQIAKGLQTLHRNEMVHQDLRPENIMIDEHGTAIIIDLGATKVAGLTEMIPPKGNTHANHIQGTMQYTAPELFLGLPSQTQSDIYSLGVIAYQMVTGQLPYGTDVSRSTTVKSQQRLRYIPSFSFNHQAPDWFDFALRKAVKIEPNSRYSAVSEFIYDLKYPNPQHFKKRKPIAERSPILFWQSISLGLALALLVSLLV